MIAFVISPRSEEGQVIRHFPEINTNDSNQSNLLGFGFCEEKQKLVGHKTEPLTMCWHLFSRFSLTLTCFSWIFHVHHDKPVVIKVNW